MTKTLTRDDGVEVVEVEEFLAADAVYEAVKEKHRKAVEELIAAADLRNQKLEAADKALRAKEISCGPFRLLGRPIERIDGEELFDQLGEKNFELVGGSVKMVRSYEVDMKVFSRCVADGEIPEEVVERVIKRTCRYSKPDKVVLP